MWLSQVAESEEDLGEEDDDEDQTCVWGTDINVPTLCRRLRRFLKHYEDEGANEPKYVALLRQANSSPSIAVSCAAFMGSSRETLDHTIGDLSGYLAQILFTAATKLLHC